MQPENLLKSSPQQHVYRPSRAESIQQALSPLIGCAICSCLSLVFAASLLLPPYTMGKFLAGLFFFLVFAPLGYLFAMAVLWHTQARIITSPQGIAYATIGYTIFSPWDQVAGKDSRSEQVMQRMQHSRLITGLQLRQPAPAVQIRRWLPAFFPPYKQPSLFIPLSNVIPDWETHVLGEDIRRSVPAV